MGSNKSQSHFRGLLIPDPRFNFATGFDDTNSVFTENTPRPGVPVAKDNSDMILETSGETNSDAKYTIYTQNSGYPEDLGGTFLYHGTSAANSYKYYGWEPPHTINGMERVHTGTSGNHHVNFDICTALDDTIVIASNKSTSAGHITIFYKKVDATTWTEVSPPYFTEPGMSRVGGARLVDGSYGDPVEAGVEPGPALVVLPSGRILCFYWIQTAEEFTGTTSLTSIKHWQIQAVFSDDSGASWAVYQNFCLIEPLSQLVDTRTDTNGRYYPGKLKAEYKDGQILMLSSAFDTGSSSAQGSAGTNPGNVYLQFASSSLGASFTLVEKNVREANSTANYDIAVSGGKFVVSYVDNGGAAGAFPYVAFLGSAYTPLSRSSQNVVNPYYGSAFAEAMNSTDGNAIGRVDLAICAVPDGSMYMVGVRHGHESKTYTRNTACIFFSGDNGSTWELVGGEWGDNQVRKDGIIYSSRFFDEPSSGLANTRDCLRNVSITWQRGRLVMVCRHLGQASTMNVYAEGDPDNNVSCMYLGGYTNLTIGSLDAAISMADRGTYGKHYFPFIEPDDMVGAWVKGTAGVPTTKNDLNGIMPYHQITTASGEAYYEVAELNHTETRNTRTELGNWGGPMISYVEFAVEVISGGSQSGHDIACRLQNGNEDEKTVAVLTFKQEGDNTRVTVRDGLADTDKHTEILTFSDASKFGEYRMLVRGRKVSVWWREYDASAVERTWNKLYESSSDELIPVTSSGFCSLIWGHMAPTTSESRWYKIQAGAHDGDLNHCAVPRMNDWMDYSSPANVGGRFYSPAHIYLKDKLQIAAKDGPAVKGDEWEHIPRHDYPIEAIHHEVSPSPAKGWKSNGRATAAELIWDIDTSPAYGLGGARALYLGDINFRYALLKGYDGSSWSTIATIDAAQKVRFIRKGKSATAYHTGVSSDQIGKQVWALNDMVGCTFNFRDTQTPGLYEITSNSGGVFEDTGNTKAPVLIVDGNPSADGVPSSGDGQIWSKDLVVYVPDDVTTTYQKIKLEIPVDVPGVGGSATNTTVSGNWEIGIAIWGHVAVFGTQYSNGHIREISPNTELFTSTGGQRRAVERGPARRSAEFSWVDPLDISAVGDTTPSPDYIAINDDTDKIIASKENAAFLVQGLLSRLQGSVVPVVFLPSVSTSLSSPSVIYDRHRFLYGRVVTASHRIENQIGDEWIGGGEGEAVTVTALRIEEEV